MQSVNEDLDGLLVRTEGTLLGLVQKSGETHLTIQARELLFEAKLDNTSAFAGKKLDLGSKLAITGVYRVQRDEHGNPRSFLLNLRDGSDVRVLAPPPWWTLHRLLLVLSGVVLVSLFAFLWALVIQRKNSLLLQAQTKLRTAHDQLEERVRERTRELREEVVAKERAHTKLSEAQQRLLFASRQAGMAEVATGILHNIGNVLNSVNVSASLIGDSLRHLRIEKFSKAAALLNEQGGNLPKFLAEDPRGRVLPEYFQGLANTMVESERNLSTEVQSLIKQVDHIKTIVAMQQNYARIGGCMENLDPVEVMEDAVQINRAAYERHGIELVREYEETPHVFADRHKTLQILINLLSNAKYASKETPSKTKRVILRLGVEGGDRVRFEVLDTGIGIVPENLERIFTLGFTTKPNGHGFGLHSGANAAKEMDGRLFALSEGVGRGATFVLELPAAEKLLHKTNVEVETA
jgi:signal transduction histidine kinase